MTTRFTKDRFPNDQTSSKDTFDRQFEPFKRDGFTFLRFLTHVNIRLRNNRSRISYYLARVGGECSRRTGITYFDRGTTSAN